MSTISQKRRQQEKPRHHPITMALAAYHLEQADSYRVGACQLIDMGASNAAPAANESGPNGHNRSSATIHHHRLVSLQHQPSSSHVHHHHHQHQHHNASPVHNEHRATAINVASMVSNIEGHGHQLDAQATAQVMVGAARATLVILMGVLVTKLILSSKKESNQKRRIRAASSQEEQSANEVQELGMSSSSGLSSQARLRSPPPELALPSELPPGPRGLPFLGYLPFVGKELHLSLTQLSNQYGPIYQIYLGTIRVVVLTDASLVRQAFRQPVFSGRPDTQMTRILQGYGIVNSDGPLWREQRAFLHMALRKLGLKSLMNESNGLESKIQNQVRELVNDLSKQANSGKSCELRPYLARSVSSVVGSIVMNSIYRMDEENKFDRLNALMEEGFKLFAIAMPLDFMPILRFLPSVSWAYKKIKQNRQETSAFFNEFLTNHRRYLSETYNLQFDKQSSRAELHPKDLVKQQKLANKHDILSTAKTTDNNHSAASEERAEDDHETKDNVEKLDDIVARDLIDAYIIQQKRHEAHGKQSYFSDKQLIQTMSDLFSAGLETVTSTIDWSVLFMVLNPDCQKRVQAEIDRVVGPDRLPQLKDLLEMPYTEATIFEVLRRSNVVPLGNAHATLEDASIGGYLIPKGTQVLPNLYGMNMNNKFWNQPEKFDPTRFLVGGESERAQKPDHFIPFSVGRRVCLGDLLAKMEVFLFLCGLLQKFDLSVAPENRDNPPKVEGTIGLSNAPVPFKVALNARCRQQPTSIDQSTE